MNMMRGNEIGGVGWGCAAPAGRGMLPLGIAYPGLQPGLSHCALTGRSDGRCEVACCENRGGGIQINRVAKAEIPWAGPPIWEGWKPVML